MATPNSKHGKNIARSSSDFVQELEEFFYQLQAGRRIFSEIALITQDLDRIYGEIATTHIERISLLKQLDRLIAEVNSPVIAANHRKH